jgi:hypothetical protein
MNKSNPKTSFVNVYSIQSSSFKIGQYEPTEKKHYLCLSKNKLVGRYLLQDNTKPAWHTDKRSIPERVQDAVDEMVVRVDDNEMDNNIGI